jgi:SAM-dependent methyltransferase
VDIMRWAGSIDRGDASVLDRCAGPVLDIGCGPGRFVRALAERGIAVLGVDLAGVAVRLTRERGGAALVRDVFARVPGEGRWRTALLVDGNVGIGADVGLLLRRAATLVAPDGRLLAEADPEHRDQTLTVRFHAGGQPIGPPAVWVRASLRTLRLCAADAGLSSGEAWTAGGRIFTVLSRR